MWRPPIREAVTRATVRRVLTYSLGSNILEKFQTRLSSTVALARTTRNVTLPPIPELFNPDFLNILIPPKPSPIVGNEVQVPENKFMDAMHRDKRSYTANGAHALESTGSPALDAFNRLNRWSFKEVNKALRLAWMEDPELALRLIWNMRTIHDGKNEKELFYRAFGWLYDNHPRTAISNLHMLVAPVCSAPKSRSAGMSHGYWKDLLNILALATCDELGNIPVQSTFLHNYVKGSQRSRKDKQKKTQKEVKKAEEMAQIRAKERRRELHSQFYERLVKKLQDDNKFRALYVAIARLFAEIIRQDVKNFKELQDVDKNTDKERYWTLLRAISLAGKWAPSPGGSHDRVTNISTAICQLLFSELPPSGGAIGPLPKAAHFPIPTNQENCLILRSFYQRWILTPLRRVIACPETLMSANKWSEIRYNRVPSVCMQRNKEHFYKHDPEGFQQYLLDVESGKTTMSGATLLPHELVGEVMKHANALEHVNQGTKYPKLRELRRNIAEQQIRVINAQWRTLITRLRESGCLDNALAVCDVSSSMGFINHYQKRTVSPIFPSIALTLVLASLARPPFDSGFITFSHNPQFVKIPGFKEKSLVELVKEINSAEWQANTDFLAVFRRLILPLAKEYRIPKDEMVKRLFVFSDMQFDSAAKLPSSTKKGRIGSRSRAADKWETSYDLVVKAFSEAGYDVPEIVFWNLSGEGQKITTEVEAERKGVAMMSGFSSAMMKTLMGEPETEAEVDDESSEKGKQKKENHFNPLNVMKKALTKPSYDGLLVVD